MQRYKVTLTTSTGQASTGYLPDPSSNDASVGITGKIKSIIYTNTNFVSSSDVTITTERNGQTVWTQSNIGTSSLVKHPRAQYHTTAGAACTGVAEKTEICVVNDRIKIVVAQGGSVKTASFEVIVE